MVEAIDLINKVNWLLFEKESIEFRKCVLRNPY